MKRWSALLAVMLAVAFAVSACSKSSQQTSSSDNSGAQATAASTEMSESSTSGGMSSEAQSGSKLPIPLAKLPVAKVAAGNASAGSQVFAANCASCHGEGGKNGTVGPTLAGAGLKAGQVAYMVRNPQGVDKDSSMPKLPLTDKQLADVSAYVASLK